MTSDAVKQTDIIHYCKVPQVQEFIFDTACVLVLNTQTRIHTIQYVDLSNLTPHTHQNVGQQQARSHGHRREG